jgi:hypothetical protein
MHGIVRVRRTRKVLGIFELEVSTAAAAAVAAASAASVPPMLRWQVHTIGSRHCKHSIQLGSLHGLRWREFTTHHTNAAKNSPVVHAG